MNGCLRRTLMTLAVLAGLLSTGCTDQIVANAARSSLTSFLTSITNQAIGSALNP